AGAGEEQHLRAVGALLELREPVEAVAAPEHVIEDQRLVGAEREVGAREVALERIQLVYRRVLPALLDVMAEEAPQVRIIVDDQYAHSLFVHDLDLGEVIGVLADARLQAGAVAAARPVLDVLA